MSTSKWSSVTIIIQGSIGSAVWEAGCQCDITDALFSLFKSLQFFRTVHPGCSLSDSPCTFPVSPPFQCFLNPLILIIFPDSCSGHSLLFCLTPPQLHIFWPPMFIWDIFPPVDLSLHFVLQRRSLAFSLEILLFYVYLFSPNPTSSLCVPTMEMLFWFKFCLRHSCFVKRKWDLPFFRIFI